MKLEKGTSLNLILIRPIRVFYGSDRCYKNYLTLDGEIVCVL